MRSLIVLSILFLTISGLSFSQVTISGSSGGNSRQQIQLFGYADPVSRREVLIADLIPDSDGRFIFTIENEGVKELFIRNGIHDNYFLLDSSNDIDLILYPFRAKTVQEKQNPYFNYFRVHCASSGTDDLNNLILNIDNTYQDIYDKLIEVRYGDRVIGEADSLVLPLLEAIDSGGNSYLNDWIISRVANLKVMLLRNQDKRIEIVKGIEDSFDPYNPASAELADIVFTKLLRDLSVKSGGEIVRSTISGEHRFPDLRDFVVSETGISNQRLVEYILLKNLFTEYYSNYFNREGIFNLLRWISKNGTFEYTRAISQEISDRIARFLPGSLIPDFTLKGENGIEYSPTSWRGKFLLLTFGASDSWVTISEFNLLRGWVKQYDSYLEIVTILCDDDFNEGLRKMNENGFNWLMLDGSENEAITDLYDINYYPAFFLFNPEGAVIRAYAPAPSENLLQILLEKLQPHLIYNINQ